MKSAIAHATIVAAIGVLPAFLTGALAIQLHEDLGIGIEQIGIATAALFTSAALFARLGGRIVHRLGSGWGMVLAPAMSTVALAVGAAANSYATLLLAMTLGGVANAVAQPVANQRLSDFVRDGMLGTAFGLKQSSVPAATLFAGLAVPGVALAAGWRWVWVVAAAAAAVTAIIGLSARGRTPALRHIEAGAPLGESLTYGTMLVFTIGAALAATVGTSLGVFFIAAAVAADFGAVAAGAMYSAFSVAGILIRIGLGVLSDRRPRQNSYLLIAALLSAVVVGCALLSIGATWTFIVGGLLAYAIGWAWPGLLNFAVVRDNRANPAVATSFLQSGSSLGAGLGPLLFGFLIAATSYETAWLMGALIGAGAAAMMLIGSRLARRG